MNITEKLKTMIGSIIEVDIEDGERHKPLSCPISNAVKKRFSFVESASMSGGNVLLRPKADSGFCDSIIIRVCPTIKSWMYSFDWGTLPVDSFKMELKQYPYEDYLSFRWCARQH